MLEYIIKNINYSTIGLSVITSYLFPSLRNQSLSIILVLFYNHIVLKTINNIKFENINNKLTFFLINLSIINRLCCLKYISLNIPIIQFEKYNYPFRISYEILNLFWKTHSNIVYGTYITTSVFFISLHIMYPLLKNPIFNIIRENNMTNRLIPTIQLLITLIENNQNQSNIEIIQNNRLSKEKLDELCPLKCLGFNNIEKINNDECCICKEKYSEKELHRTLPCNHSYHAYCIEDWIIRNKKCPLCRYELQI